MTKNEDLSGLWVPIVTPFDSQGALDLRSLERLARRVLSEGAVGLVALGTTGEPATATALERRQVVECCDRVCREMGRKLIVGAGTNGTQSTIAEVETATAGTSAVAALVVVPYYTRPSESAIVEHFAAVADASAVPLVAYNVPYRTGMRLGSAAVLALSEHPRIIGLKQAVGALDLDTLQLLAGCGGRMQVLAGDDAFIAPSLAMGASGAIAAASHVCTAAFAAMIDAGRSGNILAARTLAERLLPVVTAGFAEPTPAVWKGALARLGDIAADRVRRPMTEASPDATQRLLAAIATCSALGDHDPGRA